jgi:uncharacterized membrane protein
MNKTRAENLSDGVFAIVITLLVFNLKLPETTGPVSNAQLWSMLGSIWPLVTSCALTFLVIAIFWVNHNFLFHILIKEYDRVINLMNILYLLFLVFVPFTAYLVGTHPYNQPAALIYGLNIIAVMAMSDTMVRYLAKHRDLRAELSSRFISQVKMRTYLTEASYILGILSTFFFIPASVFFYLFPIIFNIIPGSLNLMEKVFRFQLK